MGWDSALSILGGLGILLAVGFGIFQIRKSGVVKQQLENERAARESAEAVLRAGTDAPRDRGELVERLRKEGL